MSSSDLAIAHTARKEMSNLNDPDYIPAFKELLKSDKVTINKIHLISYLVRLADKFQRNETHSRRYDVLQWHGNDFRRIYSESEND